MRARLARVGAPALLLLVLACGGGAARTTSRGVADLTNPYLGVERSQWLVGPVALLATPAEIDAYLELRDDAAAERFVEEFWARREPSVRATFEARAAQADARFSEAGYLGRRTDRGAIFVVYGPPAETDYDTLHQDQHAGPLEVWTYAEDAAPGLDGRRPQVRYRFAKRGDLTVRYHGPGSTGPKLPDPERFPRR